MIGVVIFGHGKLAHELVRAAEMILDEQQTLIPVGVEPEDGEKVITKRLEEAINAATTGDGVLLLTDMFGGTPMNFGCRFLDDTAVEVVTGVNLAQLIKALTGRQVEGVTLADLAREVAEYGRNDISVASELLRAPPAGEAENEPSKDGPTESQEQGGDPS